MTQTKWPPEKPGRFTPPIQEFLEYMNAQVVSAEAVLRTQEDLTDSQRSKLFATINVASKFTYLFTREAVQARADLEQAINDSLHAATSA